MLGSYFEIGRGWIVIFNKWIFLGFESVVFWVIYCVKNGKGGMIGVGSFLVLFGMIVGSLMIRFLISR